jgi:hypothetical protein
VKVHLHRAVVALRQNYGAVWGIPMAQRAESRQRRAEITSEVVLYYYGDCVDAERDRINTHLSFAGVQRFLMTCAWFSL